MNLTDEGLQAMLNRAIRDTLIVGLLAALILWKASGWRNAGMMAAGTLVSAASIYEWRRLARLITVAMDKEKTPRGAGIAVVLFMLRLVVFAAVIYGSLKCFQGSVVPLLFGLALAVLSLVWEVVRLLRD
jgi:hypothetical protein